MFDALVFEVVGVVVVVGRVVGVVDVVVGGVIVVVVEGRVVVGRLLATGTAVTANHGKSAFSVHYNFIELSHTLFLEKPDQPTIIEKAHHYVDFPDSAERRKVSWEYDLLREVELGYREVVFSSDSTARTSLMRAQSQISTEI